MADEPTKNQDDQDDANDPVVKAVESIEKRLDTIDAQIKKAAEVRRDPGFSIRSGEDIMSSRPFSLTRLCKAIIDGGGRGALDQHHAGTAKIELELSAKLRKYHTSEALTGSTVLVPLGTDLMPLADTKTDDGKEFAAYPAELVKECKDLMRGNYGYDPAELLRIAKETGNVQLIKDMTQSTANQGGTLVALPGQGEIIDVLRNNLVFARAGAQSFSLPTQGSIKFPRMTSDPTFAATAETATITESTPGTGELTLSAKWYASLVDLSPFLTKFASASVEAWLRRAFGESAAIQLDSHMIAGQGGTAIKGIITYSGVSTIVATTTGSNGDTLGPIDLPTMLATLENNNARVNNGVFFALRPRLFNVITHRRADAVSAADAAGAFLFDVVRGQGGFPDQISGVPTFRSTNIPNTRAKGSGTTLTLVLGGVGSSWMIGTAGVMEIDMTNSDASKFQQGIVTMRATVWADAGPQQEAEFAFIDTLLETT